MVLSNDERGWIMTCLSGVACALGAAVICVDLVIRLIPSKRNFRIENSNTFMSVSLSLSFGVMMFSALYSMLPSAKQSLIDGGNSPKAAAWILIACFIGGVVGIQILSRILHRFMPSHAVDCGHSHQGDSPKENEDSHNSSPRGSREQATVHSHRNHNHHAHPSHQHSHDIHAPQMSETSTAVSSTSQHLPIDSMTHDHAADRPSIPRRLTRKLSKLASGKVEICNTDGECYGYTDPCGDECFKSIIERGGFKGPVRNGILKPSLKKRRTVAAVPTATESAPLLASAVDDSNDERPHTERLHESRTRYYTVREDFNAPFSSRDGNTSDDPFINHSHAHHHDDDDEDDDEQEEEEEEEEFDEDGNHLLKPRPTSTNPSSYNTPESQNTSHNHHHHHHVPTNAFLSIGLQTSIAIALHKLPEGFITYATNHANPQLGVAVFLALFIHNITEGFAMALPLYLAIRSRTKAMMISFVLGGLSQPLGAAVAAVWFHVAGQSNWAPDESVYGGMFAVTAGIMASVGLQLFGESLELTHSKMLCFVGAFCGMAILGVSSALTSK